MIDSSKGYSALQRYRAAEKAAYGGSDMAMVDLFAEDVVMAACGMTTLRGRLAVREFYIEFWRDNDSSILEAIDEEVDDLGSHLIVSGHFRVEIRPKSGALPIVNEGRYLSIFRRRLNGDYELWREAGLDRGPVLTPPIASQG